MPREHAKELLLHSNATARETQFMRNYFGNTPSVKQVRSMRSEILESMPDMMVLRLGSTAWENIRGNSLRVPISSPGDIECVRFSLRNALECYLHQLDSVNRWPIPPLSKMIDASKRDTSLVFPLSVDSGQGMLKLMGRFSYEDTGQNTRDVMLLSEAVGKVESFERLELDHMKRIGVTVHRKSIDVHVVHVHDYKVLYLLLGRKVLTQSTRVLFVLFIVTTWINPSVNYPNHNRK